MTNLSAVTAVMEFLFSFEEGRLLGDGENSAPDLEGNLHFTYFPVTIIIKHVQYIKSKFISCDLER